MSFSEIKKEMFGTFFLAFFGITIMMSIYIRFTGRDSIPISEIFAVAVLSGLTTLATLVLYSKKELRRLELLVRHAICLTLEVVIVLFFAVFRGWLSWNDPALIIVFVGMVTIVHIMALATDFYWTKVKADEMTKKISELNK